MFQVKYRNPRECQECLRGIKPLRPNYTHGNWKTLLISSANHDITLYDRYAKIVEYFQLCDCLNISKRLGLFVYLNYGFFDVTPLKS